MQKFLNRSWPGAIISGLLAYIAICHINFICSWICYVPLFVSIYDKAAKKVFKTALIFGFTFSCLAFSWMIPGAERFTGYNVFYGIGVFLISAAFFSLFTGAFLYCFALLKRRDEQQNSVLINSVLIASIYCIAEALLSIISAGFPWFDVHSANGLAENKYAIQPAAFFGMDIMTFVVVIVNYPGRDFSCKKIMEKFIYSGRNILHVPVSRVFYISEF